MSEEDLISPISNGTLPSHQSTHNTFEKEVLSHPEPPSIQTSSSSVSYTPDAMFACPPPDDVHHIEQVDWGDLQPKTIRQDPCGCTAPSPGLLCCTDESCVLFACQEECGSNCVAQCGNRRIRNKQWKRVQVFDAGPKKGRGLRALEPIQKGEFIIEYVGKAIRKKDLDSLFESYQMERMLYVMSLDGDIYIDARKSGGLARYINHSCQPNCKVDRWKVSGVSRAVVFATADIPTGGELTFDYKWIRKRGRAPTKCYCQSLSCRGTLELSITKEESEFNVHLEGHWTVPKSIPEEDLVNRTVKLFFEGNQEYFVANVCKYDSDTRKHLLFFKYDAEESWEDLSKEKWMILDEEGEKFVIKRKQLVSNNHSSNNSPITTANGQYFDATSTKEPYVFVSTQVKQSLTDKRAIQICEQHLRVHIHTSKYSRQSYLASNDNALTEEVKEIFETSSDGMLWKLSLTGLKLSEAVEYLSKNIESIKQQQSQQQHNQSKNKNNSEDELVHVIVYPRAISDSLKQKLPQVQAKHRAVEFEVMDNVSRTVEMIHLKEKSCNIEDIQNAKVSLWNEMKPLCLTHKIQLSTGGHQCKQLGFRVGSLDDDQMRLLLSIEDAMTPVDVFLKEAPFFCAVENTLECSIWIQTEDDVITMSSSKGDKRDVFIGGLPSKAESVWVAILDRLADLNTGARFLHHPKMIGFVQTLLCESPFIDKNTMGASFLNYVTELTGVEVAIDYHTTRGWVKLCDKNAQDRNPIDLRERVQFAEHILHLQMSLLESHFARRNHRWMFGRSWALEVVSSYDEDQIQNSNSLDPDSTVKRSVLSEFGNYAELCDDIVEFAKSASLDQSVAAHATIILYRYLSRISKLPEPPSGKPKDFILACIFIANKCQRRLKWKRLEQLIEEVFTDFYPDLVFSIDSDAALNLEKRILAAEKAIIETLLFDVSWEGMAWVLKKVLDFGKVSEEIARNAFNIAMSGIVLAAGPQIWLNYGPRYVFAALVGLLSVDICPLIVTLGLFPQKLVETAERIVDVIKEATLHEKERKKSQRKKKRATRDEVLSPGVRSMFDSYLPPFRETCNRLARDPRLLQGSIKSERLPIHDVKCIIEGVDNTAAMKALIPSLGQISNEIGCKFFVDSDPKMSCKIVLEGGWRSLAVAENAIIEVLQLQNIPHQTSRVVIDSENDELDPITSSWLQNNYERSVMPLQLKDILLSEATSTSKSFLCCNVPSELICDSGLAWWNWTNIDSSNGYLQNSFIMQSAFTSEGSVQESIKGIAYSFAGLIGAKERIKLQSAIQIKRQLSSSQQCQSSSGKLGDVEISLKRWPSDKAEAKQTKVKSSTGLMMPIGFSPAALQEMQLLHELHSQVDSPRGHPNIIMPLTIGVPSLLSKKESQVVSESSDFDRPSTSVESYDFDYIPFPQKSNISTALKSVEEISEGSSYLVFEPISLVMQQILTRRKLNSNYKKDNDIVTPVLFTSWFYDLLNGLAHCHTNDTVLKVLKPDQIYLDRCGVAKLGEFGGSITVPFGQAVESDSEMFKIKKRSHRERDDPLGDPYQAPELLLGFNQYSKQSDVWSLGALMATLLLGKQFFSGKDRNSLLISMFKVTGTPSSSNFPAAKKSPYFDQVKGMMNKDKSYKHDIAKAISKMLGDANIAEEYTGALQILDKMLRLDPMQRISAADALKDSFMRNYFDCFRSSDSRRAQYAMDWKYLRCQLTSEKYGSPLVGTNAKKVCKTIEVDAFVTAAKRDREDDMEDDLYGDIQPRVEWKRQCR